MKSKSYLIDLVTSVEDILYKKTRYKHDFIGGTSLENTGSIKHCVQSKQ